jgi:four helix bundle protein
MKYTDFTTMPVWRLSMDIAEAVFQITEQLPRKEDYALTSQLRRAALSMSSNVAEGFGRSGGKDKSKFYEYARSSGFEVRNDLIYGVRVGYFTSERQDKICLKIKQFTHEINKLMCSLNR